MAEWGGPRPGAGRKPREPGQVRVSLSTRISNQNSERLRALAARTGKTLGQVVDEVIAYATAQPAFERLLGALEAQGAAMGRAGEPVPSGEAGERREGDEGFGHGAREPEALGHGRESWDAWEAQAGLLFARLPLAIAWADRALTLKAMNEAWAAAFGAEDRALIGLRLDEVLGACHGEAAALARAAAESGQPQRLLLEQADAAPGTCLEIVLTPILGLDGQPCGIVSHLRWLPPPAVPPLGDEGGVRPG